MNVCAIRFSCCCLKNNNNMKRSLILLFSFHFIMIVGTYAQHIYVDADAKTPVELGTVEAPFGSLAKAIAHANALTGQGEILIEVLPGIYLLDDRVDVNPVRVMSDSTRFIIKAAIMPDDTAWTPQAMPVIQSISENNSSTQFPHATGLLIASSHVSIQGLKFLGNANPKVNYYYPISKEDQDLRDLLISQCYFIGDKEAAKIQGGIWAHGPQNTVSHCIFYGCRNAVLFFKNVEGFTIEHTIVYGSYESAFWFGREDYAFTFTHNVIANNAYFLVGPKDLTYSSSFSHSVIQNKGFVGYFSREGQSVMELSDPDIKMDHIRESGLIQLQMNLSVELDTFHLHLTKDSEGADLQAGIFH